MHWTSEERLTLRRQRGGLAYQVMSKTALPFQKLRMNVSQFET